MYKYLLSVGLTCFLIASLTTANAQSRPRSAPKKTTTTRPYTPPAPKPDLLVRRDGTQLEVLVTEITDNEIVYKRASNPNGPIFRSQKTDFSYLQYGSNGEIEQFTKVVRQTPVPDSRPSTPAPDSRPSTPAPTSRYTDAPVNRSRSVAASQGVRFGFKTGIQGASQGGNAYPELGYSAKGILGFQPGLAVNIPLSSTISLRPQLLYSGKGTNLTSTNFDQAKITINYIEVPVDVLVKIPMSSGQFLLGGGGYFGYALNAKNGSKTLSIGSSSKDAFVSTDFGLRFSGWYDLTSGVTVNVFYNLGVSNLNTLTDEYTIKNRTIGLGVGYFLSR